MGKEFEEFSKNAASRLYYSIFRNFGCQLGQIWQHLLDVQSIGVQDNFFELGGHSLLAVKLFNEIETTFGKQLS